MVSATKRNTGRGAHFGIKLIERDHNTRWAKAVE